MDKESNNVQEAARRSAHHDAWLAVMDVLDEVAPGWNLDHRKSGIECAVQAIRKLGRNQNEQ